MYGVTYLGVPPAVSSSFVLCSSGKDQLEMCCPGPRGVAWSGPAGRPMVHGACGLWFHLRFAKRRDRARAL